VNDLSTLIDRYLAAYGDPDKTRRTLAVSGIWAEGGELIDPPLTATGHAQIVAQSDALLSQFPGHRFRRSSGVGRSPRLRSLCMATDQSCGRGGARRLRRRSDE
jgi:hypothetical protein